MRLFVLIHHPSSFITVAPYKNAMQICTIHMMNRWDFFLGLCALVIVTCMMVPRAFGLQYFSQWGGMYTDGWCAAELGGTLVTSGELNRQTGAMERILAGDTSRGGLVWFPPMHREETCIAWVRSWCGQLSLQKMPIVSAFAHFQNHFLEQSKNICILDDRPSFHWFSR